MSNLTGDIMNYLGLDYGSRVIGIARINSFAKISEPLQPIRVNVENDIIKSISDICSNNDINGVVVGLPRGLDGQDTQQTIDAISFAKDLKNNLSVSIFMIDEAGTTVEAKEIIGNKPLSVDSQAAALILNNFISHPDKKGLEL